MIRSLILQAGSPSLTDLINLVGIALLLGYVYYHFQYKNAKERSIQREMRKKSIGIIVVFLFYSVVVATYGLSGTWVGQIGLTVDSYFQQFARELVLAESPTRNSGDFGSIVKLLKTLGLITYVLVTGIASVSVSIPVKIFRTLF